MIEATIAGSGKPIVLIHAFPLSSQMWRGQIDALAKQRPVIAPDLPGFGRSASVAASSIAEMAREVIALLDKQGITEPVFMAGLSMGGYVVFEVLRQFPERVQALGLFSTRATADTPEGREKRMQAIELIQKYGLKKFGEKIISNLLGTTTLEQKPDVKTQVATWIQANSADGVINAQRAMANRRDSSDLCAQIKCPVLMVFGEEDTFVPLAEAQSFRARIPHAEFHALPRAGHLVNLEDPQAFNSLLASFLQKI